MLIKTYYTTNVQMANSVTIYIMMGVYTRYVCMLFNNKNAMLSPFINYITEDLPI